MYDGLGHFAMYIILNPHIIACVAGFFFEFAFPSLAFFSCHVLLAASLPAGQPLCGLWLGQGLGCSSERASYLGRIECSLIEREAGLPAA